MRQSMIKFLDQCHVIKAFLKETSYELNDCDDGSSAIFKVRKIFDLSGLLQALGGLECRLYEQDGYIRIVVLEDYGVY